jgi:hypothetical protein
LKITVQQHSVVLGPFCLYGEEIFVEFKIAREKTSWEPLQDYALGYQLMVRSRFGLRGEGRTAGSAEPNNRTGSVKPNRDPSHKKPY